jgi:hypothetical protein
MIYFYGRDVQQTHPDIHAYLEHSKFPKYKKMKKEFKKLLEIDNINKRVANLQWLYLKGSYGYFLNLKDTDRKGGKILELLAKIRAEANKEHLKRDEAKIEKQILKRLKDEK